MKKEEEKNNFGDSGAFGFGGLPLVNNSSTHKILEHFNQGFKLNYTHDEDDTDTARVQDSLL